MTVAPLIIAVIALAVAYLAWQRALGLARDLAQTKEDLHAVRSELAQSLGTLGSRMDELGRESRRQSGQLRFTPGMTIAEALQVHPRVAEVLAQFELGGCSNCAVSDVDTLEGACRSYGIDQDKLMAALARLASAPDDIKPINVGKMRVQI